MGTNRTATAASPDEPDGDADSVENIYGEGIMYVFPQTTATPDQAVVKLWEVWYMSGKHRVHRVGKDAPFILVDRIEDVDWKSVPLGCRVFVIGTDAANLPPQQRPPLASGVVRPQRRPKAKKSRAKAKRVPNRRARRGRPPRA